MLKGAVARRYAEAVFEIGVQQNTVDRWHDDVQTLAEYFGNRRLAFILSEPKIPYTRKELVVRDLLAGKVQQETLNLGLLLVERGLVELAPAIRTQFETLYNEYRGQAIAQVTTAIPLDETLRANIATELQEMTGKRIILREKVDPSILGGAIARVGDTLIDGSLRRRFQLLRDQIVQGGFGGPTDGAEGGDGNLAPLPGSDGGSNGPVLATDTAPRAPQGPHMAPRQQPGSSSGNNPRPGRANNNNKRRRR